MTNISTCPDRNRLASYLTGATSDAEAETLEGHLETCADCLALLNALSDEERQAAQATANNEETFLAEPECREAVVAAAALAVTDESEAVADPRLGRVLGNYRLLDRLGGGGMGIVYLAENRTNGALVAVKLLHPQFCAEPKLRKRFAREVALLRELNHPRFVRYLDAGRDADQDFLVTEYLAGVDGARLLDTVGPLEVANACEFARQAAEGFAGAHAMEIVHRDVKPSNLLLTDSGQAKILDLGLARLGLALRPELSTLTHGFLGTLDYIAPEQLSESHQVDTRADIYGLGATLYKWLTGHSPHERSEPNVLGARWQAIATQPNPSILTLKPDLDPALAAVVDRMLARDPRDRFASMQDVANALSIFTAGHDLAALVRRVPARQSHGLEKAARARRMRRRFLWAAATTAAALPMAYGLRALTQRPVMLMNGHRDLVTSIAVSPDKRLVLSASQRDRKVVLWDLASGTLLREFNHHQHFVQGVDFSPDGKFGLSGSADYHAVVFDIESGTVRRRFTGHESWIFEVAYAPDGEHVLTGAGGRWDGTWRAVDDAGIRLWNIDSGQEVRRLEGHVGAVRGLAVSRDGKRVLSSGDDHSVRLWDVATGQQIRQFKGHDKAVEDVKFLADGARAISIGADGTLRLWDLESGREITRLGPFPFSFLRIAITSDDRFAATSHGHDPVVRIWDLTAGRQIDELPGTRQETYPVVLSPDNRYLLFAGGAGGARERGDFALRRVTMDW